GMTKSYYPFGSSFANGVYVAAGDYDNDHKVDVIVSADAGWVPLTGVFSGATLLSPATPQAFIAFEAFDPSTRSGVRVAARPVDGGDPGFVEHVSLLLSTAHDTGVASHQVMQTTFAGYNVVPNILA